jgi:hypothetical protein
MESKDIKPQKGYITAIFFLLIIMLFLVYTVWDNNRIIQDIEEREARLVEERDSLRDIVSDIKSELKPDDPAVVIEEKPSRSLLSNFDINRLKRQGLDNPVKNITEDLLGRGDLIRQEGIMGGTMGFYSPENIHILTPQWVFAYFEDGHIRGEMLLKYTVESNGTLTWEVIESYLDN